MASNTTSTCSADMSGSATISVNPLPIPYTVTGGGTFCSGSTGAAVGLSSSTPGVSYQLYNGTAAVGSPVAGTGSAISFGLNTNAGTYTVLATNTSTSCTRAMTGSATINVNAQPTAYAMTGGGTYCAGGAGVNVGLSGSNTGVNYQLYNGATAVGTAVAGTGGALSFGMTTAAGVYSVVATNPLTGCTGNMSGSSIVAVNAVPVAQTVMGGGSYCAGGNGVFVTLSGSQTGVNYRLYNGTTAMSSTTPGTGGALSFGLQTVAGTYTVLATQTATTCTSAMTGSATISINALPTAHIITGGGSYCAGGNGVAVGLSGSNTGISYQLYNGSSTVGSAMPGTGSSISFGLKTAAGTYSIMATNSSTSCTAGMSGTTTISVNDVPAINSVTGGGNYCAGGAGMHVGLDGSATGINYQLYNGTATVGAAVAGTGADLDFGLIMTAGTYSVRATNPVTGCTSDMNEMVDVNVNALPSAFTVTGGGSYCAGGNGVAVGLAVSDFGINYQLYNGSTAVGSAVAGTGGAISFGLNTNAGSYNVVATNALTGCTKNMTGSATIAINAVPVAYNLSGGGNFCAGSTSAPIVLDGSNSGITYTLYNGTSSAGIVMGTGSAISFGTTSVAGTYSVMASNGATSCSAAMTGTASVSVNALPATYTLTGGGSFCAGGAGVVVGLSNSQTGVAYQLYMGTTAVGAPVTGTGNAISFGTQAAGVYTAMAENTTTHCTRNMSGSSTVTIAAPPAVYTMTGGGAYCAGGTGYHVGIDGSQTGVTYKLYNGTALVGGAVSGTGVSIDFGVMTAAGSYSVVATETAHGCVSNMTGASTIVVNPLPATHTVTGGGNFCAGGTGVNVAIDGSDAGVTYTLYNGSTMVGSAMAGTGSGLSFGAQNNAGNYTVMAADATTACSSNMAGSATVVANPLPSVYNVIATASSYCAGGTGVNIMLSGSNSGISYMLYNGASPAGTAVAGTGSSISFGNKTAAGTYTVVATNTATGCMRNMSGSAPVSINPQPAGFPVTGGGAMCAGSAGVAVGLAGSEAGINYNLYMGTTAIGTSVTGSGGALTFGPQNTSGTYSVVAVNPATGCSHTMPGNAIILTNPLPSVYTVTGGGSYCNGGAGVHIGLSGSSTGISYQLYKDGMATGSLIGGTGAAMDLGLFTAAGVYSITANNAITTCTSNMTGSVTVAVNALPVAYNVTGGGGYCNGTSGVAVGLANSEAGITYRLYKGATLVATAAGGAGAVSFGLQTATGVYSVSAINTATGCAKNMTGTVTVSVNPLPAVQTVTGGGSYCEGGTGVNVGLASSELGVQYRLYQGVTAVGAPVAGTGLAISLGFPTAEGVYTVVATNGATCTRFMSGSAAVTILPTSVPSVSMSLSTTNTVCAGTSVNFTATPVNGGSAPVYQWNVNGGAITGATSASYAYAPANGDEVTVTMTSNAACPVPATVASSSETMTVNPTHMPVVTIAPDHDGPICKGASVMFTATPENGGTAPIYSWMRNGAFAGAGAVYTVVPDDNDVIYCMMTSNLACRSANTVTSSSDTMEVVEPTLPTIVITTDANGTVILPGQYVNFSAVVSGAGPNPEFQWIINGDAIVGATTTSFITNLLKNHDTITCRILSSGPCGGTYSFNTIVIEMGNVGVATAPVKEMDIHVMPNPNNGTFVVKGSLGTINNEPVELSITNMLGQVIYTNTVKAQHGSIEEHVTLDNTLSNGMYLLNLRAGERSKVFHVTISR
jgi:hypothetical protein